jgi:adenylosuccinate lyase
MLHRAARLVEGLVVHEDRIRANLESTRGLVHSESLLLALVETGLPRQEAYARVQRAAMRVWDEGLDFVAAAGADPDITGRLDPDALARVFDPAHALRHEAAILRRALAE